MWGPCLGGCRALCLGSGVVGKGGFVSMYPPLLPTKGAPTLVDNLSVRLCHQPVN